MASTLQQAKLPLSSHSECARNWGGSLDRDAHLCAGAKGSGGCNGDSGGPLACEVGGKWAGFFTAPLALANATVQQMSIPYLPESQVTITGLPKKQVRFFSFA